MKETFNFTLYEVFGYLMPGLIAAVGLLILFWSMFHGGSVLPLSLWRLSSTGVLAILFVAYLLGHAVQALGNIVFKGADQAVMSDGKNPLMPVKNPLVPVAKSRVANLFPERKSEIDDCTWLLRVMDESCIQVGQQGDREIFTYREGFYRGSTVAIGLFGVGVTACIIAGNLHLRVGETTFAPSRCELDLILSIAALVGFGFYRRFRRFSEMRVARVVAAFLVLPKEKSQGQA